MPAAVTAEALAAAASNNVDVGSLMYQFDNQLNRAGYDLKGLFRSIDIHTIGFLTLVVVGAVLLFDLINYGISVYLGHTSTYSSYGRSLATNAARLWEHRDQYDLSALGRGGRGLDSSVTNVLDSLAEAIIKYDEEENIVEDENKTKQI
ncbi:hypothetical protein SK128_020709 [Halocaridina rubra]|uniref:Uncharacterized protein n=1 Tax=Halocaridina rubra TaxID=373956 RepID=A0AAN9AGT3_HALRR